MNFWELLDGPKPVPVTGVSNGVVRYDGPGQSPYGAAALDRECATLASAVPGTRNDTLNRAAFALAQLVASGHLDAELVRDRLTQAARLAGLGPVEVAATLASGGGAGLAHPRHVPPIEPTPQVHVLAPLASSDPGPVQVHPEGDEDPSTGPTGVEEWVRETLPAIDWWDLWDEDGEDDEWLVFPVIPARRLVALYSPPKVGKSLLMLELAAAVATGRTVLGHTPDRPRRVLYVDFENDPRGDIRPRLEAMGYGPEDLEGLTYLSFPTLGALDTERGGAELLAAATVYKADLVVIDTVSRAVAGEENENDTWLRFYRSTGVRLKAAGVACVRLDHAGKDATKGQRGGSAKSGDVDLVWRLSFVTETLLTLVCEANRLPVPQKVLTFERRGLPAFHSFVADRGARPTGRVPDPAVVALATTMDELGLPVDVGFRTASARLRGAGRKFKNDALRAAIRARKISGGTPLLGVTPEAGVTPLTPKSGVT